MAKHSSQPEQAEDSLDAAAAEIRVTSLTKSYSRGKVSAVKGVGFEVEKGQVFGLIGPDGAGKTSVLQILAGVLSADGGTASIAGVDAVTQPEAIKPLIGYMPQGLGLNLYDSLTVAENIEFFRELRNVPEVEYQENRERLLHMTRLEPFLDRPAGQLSGGMRQKLALICTLIHLPDILLLDEPTTGVDPVSRRDFWTIIHELVAKRAVTVLLTTAYMDEAERCHRVALMHEGEFIAEGSPEKLALGLSGGVVSISDALPRAVLAALHDWPQAESYALFGAEVHVLLSEGQQSLNDRLQEKGIHHARIQAIPAQLEDVFVHQMQLKKASISGADASSLIQISTTVEKAANAISTSDLSRHFGDFAAVDQVSLDVQAGEIYGLLGPNGAGKTTLIKMLCGLLPPTAGSAEVAGCNIQDGKERLANSIGYMSQRFSLYRDLSIQANLELYAGLYGLSKQTRRTRIETLLSSLDIERYRSRLTGALPLGLRQRLALGCTLLHQPPLLFLDEPTSGVDPIARRQFWDLVHLLAQEGGVTVLVSTHYMDEAEHCDRLGLMQEGRLIAVGNPAQLKQEAQQRAGPLIMVQAEAFAQAFQLLREYFPTAMLYGRRIQWQSIAPEQDIAEAQRLLAEHALSADVTQGALSMEETFVSFLQLEGGGNG